MPWSASPANTARSTRHGSRQLIPSPPRTHRPPPGYRLFRVSPEDGSPWSWPRPTASETEDRVWEPNGEQSCLQQAGGLPIVTRRLVGSRCRWVRLLVSDRDSVIQSPISGCQTGCSSVLLCICQSLGHSVTGSFRCPFAHPPVSQCFVSTFCALSFPRGYLCPLFFSVPSFCRFLGGLSGRLD